MSFDFQENPTGQLFSSPLTDEETRLRGQVMCSKSPAGVEVGLKQGSSSLVAFSLQHCPLYNVFVLAILSCADITIDPRILFH